VVKPKNLCLFFIKYRRSDAIPHCHKVGIKTGAALYRRVFGANKNRSLILMVMVTSESIPN
jgi:hypothetical protein